MNEPPVKVPLVMKAWPSIASEAMPSGELMLKVPAPVSAALAGSDPGPPGVPTFSAASLTITSPPLASGVRLEISGVELPIEIVSVVCEVSPSPSLIV
ncbi:MAG: hypothetical protein E5W76_17095 [Mesorhizobium sp.]|nr:MAG: hypothetical protein E5W76_17095 [Mesorhizobium sp.]